MKVLMLNGSPHASGVNDLALREMEAVFKENGVETEIIQVGNLAVRGCSACGACTKLGKCVYASVYMMILSMNCYPNLKKRMDWSFQVLYIMPARMRH